MLDKGAIRESNSPWSAPAILVPKKSPDGKPKFRFSVDFLALNSVTKFDSYPLPKFEETSTLYGCRYFSTLDCIRDSTRLVLKKRIRKRLDSQYRLDTMN